MPTPTPTERSTTKTPTTLRQKGNSNGSNKNKKKKKKKDNNNYNDSYNSAQSEVRKCLIRICWPKPHALRVFKIGFIIFFFFSFFPLIYFVASADRSF